MLDILNENKKNHSQARVDISIGLLHKALKHLTKAVRDIESASQYMEDNERREKIESFKQSLMGDFGTQFSNFNDNYDGHDKLINRIDIKFTTPIIL